MKIFAVAGSMRNGNTELLVKSMSSEIRKETGVEVKEIPLRNISIGFCDGCLACDEIGSCVKEDDMTTIANEAREADGFIFASPARWSLLSGELKTFFDRLNPLAVNEELSGKFAVAIAVGQSEEDDKGSIDNTIKSISEFCTNAGIEVVGNVAVCACYGAEDVMNKTDRINDCNKLARKLVNKIRGMSE